MKLIIDIPDHLYTVIKNKECTHRNVLTEAVENGIPYTEFVIYIDGYMKGLDVLDKIRAKIEEHVKINQCLNIDRAKALCWCLDIIDKYKAESEDKT